jgi:hypothetical protein
MAVGEAIAALDQERQAIWLEPPDEVCAIMRGEIPRGTGSKGQYLSTLIFAENELRTMTDEVLWYLWELAAVRGGVELKSLQALVGTLVDYEGHMFDYVGLPRTAGFVARYVRAVDECRNLTEFCDLTGAALSYLNRVHGWVDILFPWGICDGFRRNPRYS